MMNILHIMDFAAPYPGNFIASIERLEKHVNLTGSKIVYLFPEITSKLDWCIDLQKQGKIIYFIDETFFSLKIKYSNIKSIIDIIKKGKIGIVHTNFVETNYSLFLIKNVFKKRVKIIGQFQNHYLPAKNILRKLKIYVTRSTYDRIIGVSESVVKSVLDTGIKSNKVSCVCNSLATGRLNKFEDFRISDKENQNVVLMFGWPYNRKGVDIAIEAIRQLNYEGSDIILAISLSGGQSIVENEIRNQLGNLPNWIKLLKPREDIASYYNACDIFLSSSREEGFTFAVLEAAYCNCMLIVSDIGGNPQDIPFSEKYKFDDIFQLKILINKILNIPKPELSKIRKVQKNYVSVKYDLDNWAKRIMENYLMISD